MKKLIALLITISLVACSSPKKATKVKGTDNRYHDFSGFQKKEVKHMFTGW